MRSGAAAGPTEQPGRPKATADGLSWPPRGAWSPGPAVGGLPESGYLGDIPTANPLRRAAGIVIDAVVSVVVPFYVAAAVHLPGGQPLALIALAVLANEGSGYETGQTLGKRLMGLQAVRPVVTRSGTHAIVNRGYAMNLIRALLHVVDFGLWFISIPVMFVNRYHQSLGDILTRIKVIQPSRVERLARAPRHAITT